MDPAFEMKPFAVVVWLVTALWLLLTLVLAWPFVLIWFFWPCLRRTEPRG
jgi:hypothetical protein